MTQTDFLAQLERLEASREALIGHALDVSVEVARLSGRQALAVRELIRTVARLSTFRSYPDLVPVDWPVERWAEELFVGRSTAYKILGIATAAGVIRGAFGDLVICPSGLCRWVAGAADDQASAIRAAVGSGSRRAGPPRGPSAPRTEESAPRTEKSAPRIPSIYSHPSNTDTEPEPGTVRPADRGRGFLGNLEGTNQPELEETLDQLVVPLDPEELIRGAWVFLEDRTLGSVLDLVVWFRRQLGLEDPVTGNTVAHLLIVLAVARYARELPESEVRKSRVGVFVSTITRAKHFRAFKYLPTARDDLAGFLEKHPKGLDGQFRRLPTAPIAEA